MRKVRITLSASMLVLVLAFASCTSLTYSERTIKTVDPQTSAHVMPVVSDLNVSDQKATTTCTFNEKLSQTDVNLGPNSRKVKELKAEALTEASKKLNCDIIVAPVYEVVAIDHQTVEVKVSGYPANYSGFRKASLSDIELLLKNDSLLLLSGNFSASDWQNTKIFTKSSFSRGPGFDIRIGAGLLPNVSVGFEYYLSEKLSVGIEGGYDFSDYYSRITAAIDARYYFSDKPFSPFVDFKGGVCIDSSVAYSFFGPSVGLSYKYLDFSAGILLVDFYEIVPTIGLNYNIQLKKK